ncbi:hypothetical protein Sjap_020205 [Stephania japonica]|uniref:Uncharacterized protein n=1 Tax=Stephania japonica TaxID=461633 RepID=A0AAP0F096_9MAGN
MAIGVTSDQSLVMATLHSGESGGAQCQNQEESNLSFNHFTGSIPSFPIFEKYVKSWIAIAAPFQGK